MALVVNTSSFFSSRMTEYVALAAAVSTVFMLSSISLSLLT